MIRADPLFGPLRQGRSGLGTSEWLTIDQGLIDRFADVTGDHMWVHSDAERAARGELPGGRPIAHGLLTYSLIRQLSYQISTSPTRVRPSATEPTGCAMSPR